MQPKHRRHHYIPAVPVSDVPVMEDGVQQQAQSFHENVVFLTLDLLARTEAGYREPPFSGPFTLRLSMNAAVRLAPHSSFFAASDIERVVKAIQCALSTPKLEIVEQHSRAARWQVLVDSSRLAAGAQDAHNPIHHRALVNMTLIAAALGSGI